MSDKSNNNFKLIEFEFDEKCLRKVLTFKEKKEIWNENFL